MTAAVLYGSEDLKIEKVEIPALGPDDALVRVKVALTCGTDLKVWKQGFHPRMITPPAIFGHELSGVVETLGRDVLGGLRAYWPEVHPYLDRPRRERDRAGKAREPGARCRASGCARRLRCRPARRSRAAGAGAH